MRFLDRRARARTAGAILILIVATGLSGSSAAQPGDATYRITFETTWTAVTHPTSYPSNPHFSGLVGGTHDATVDFWSEGELASLGIQRTAEWGNQSDMANEVQAAIAAGGAGRVLAHTSLWDVPGSTRFDFLIREEFPLVTLVTMIAPSPDWFLGVDGLDLRPGGQWAEQIVVDLYPWDAGTDSGATYSTGDVATVPHEPIFLITGGPMTPGVPLGTFTFTLLGASSVPEAVPLTVKAFPNPFNPRTTLAWDLPASGTLRVSIYDAAGRLVRELRNGPAASGSGQAVWDGRDAAGRAVAAGAYVYRVDGTAGRASGRLTLVK